ncbi:MAG: SCP2 sterol-binding domain-containing protein [Deltaproteobacteria bacterium]|nr:SCP2 sterol-binding domain-containing protein [Deltaproteobacteria bacterium]
MLPEEKLPVATSMEVLLGWLRKSPPILRQRIGGDVEFVVREGDKIVHWTFKLTAGEVALEMGKAVAPSVRVGIRQGALTRLVKGNLDVELAFKAKKLAFEGDPAKVERLCSAFMPPTSSAFVRSSKKRGG